MYAVTAEVLNYEVREAIKMELFRQRFDLPYIHEARMAKLTAQRFCPHLNIIGERCKDCGATYTGLYRMKRKP